MVPAQVSPKPGSVCNPHSSLARTAQLAGSWRPRPSPPAPSGIPFLQDIGYTSHCHRPQTGKPCQARRDPDLRRPPSLPDSWGQDEGPAHWLRPSLPGPRVLILLDSLQCLPVECRTAPRFCSRKPLSSRALVSGRSWTGVPFEGHSPDVQGRPGRFIFPNSSGHGLGSG